MPPAAAVAEKQGVPPQAASGIHHLINHVAVLWQQTAIEGCGLVFVILSSCITEYFPCSQLTGSIRLGPADMIHLFPSRYWTHQYECVAPTTSAMA